MQSKAIATISKFSGMNGDGGMFYIDGFSVENENGAISLDENYITTELFNSGTNNYSNLANIMAIKYIYPLTGSTISNSTGYTMVMDDTSLFYTYDIFSQVYRGKVAGTSSSGSYLYCQKPDLFQLPSGNLIYTSSKHLGLMIRGLCKSSSSTTKIVDKDGRNFTTLGLSSTAPNNKVTNLKTGAEYTITSISTTDSTNDTLNFSAGTANTENDEFIALVNTKWDLNYDDGTTGGTPITIPTFKGQQTQVYWSRPIRQYGNQYLILNGNYLAILANDESTIDCTYKQLPIGYQGLSMEVSGTNILISAFDSNGKAHLLLWDGFTDGWNEILDISRAPSALKAYNFGWIYLSDGIIYYTDGRNIQKLISHPDSINLGIKYNTSNHNGIEIIDDIMYFAVRGDSYNRMMNGILVFNPKTGLTYFKCKRNGTGFATTYSLAVKSNTNPSGIYSTRNDIEIGCANSLNNLNEFSSSSSANEYKSFVYFIDFQQLSEIKQVWLNLKRISKTSYTNRTLNSIISVNYGNGNYPIIKYGQIGNNTTTTANNTSGAIFPGIVGEEIELISGDLAGQRSFITNITNPGTSNEAWSLSPALSASSNNSSDLRIWSVKNGETKNVSITDLDEPVKFNVNFKGSKMWLEITVRGGDNTFPVSINDIILI